MLGKLLQPEIESVLETGNVEELEHICSNLPPADIAEILLELSHEHQVTLLENLPVAKATEVFEQLEIGHQEDLIDTISNLRVAELINEMAADNRTALLESLSPTLTKQLLSFLQPSERAIAQSLLNFPKDSVGRLMTPDFLVIRKEWTVEQTLDFIQKNGQDKETLNALYLVDDKGHLIDDIHIREVLLSPRDRRISELMDYQYVSLPATAEQEEAVHAFKRYNRTALPIVDGEGFLVGIITIDDVLHVAEEEFTEDIHKLGAVSGLSEPYMQTPIFQMVKKRGGWLTVLFLSEMLTATAMGFYQNEISKAVVLALFIPLIISSGGNSGSQAATLVIRAIALGEIHFRDWWRVLGREIVAGLCLGLVLGIVGFLRISIWSQFSAIYGPHWMLVAISIFFSLIGVVMWGTLMGAMLPIVLKKFGADPATSSAPFVATFIDVTGIVIYFNIAMFVMRGKLL